MTQQGTSFHKMQLELQGCKVCSNMVPRSFLKFQISSLSCLKDLIQKQCFHIKMELWITIMLILRPDSQTLRAFFSHNQLSLICYDIIKEITIFQECRVPFQKFCTKFELKEQPFRKWQSKIWTSDSTGPFRCVELHIVSLIK